MSMGVYITPVHLIYKVDFGVIHIGVGFCVARSTEMGNAKTSNSGTGNRYRLPRFFVYGWSCLEIQVPRRVGCWNNT